MGSHWLTYAYNVFTNLQQFRNLAWAHTERESLCNYVVTFTEDKKQSIKSFLSTEILVYHFSGLLMGFTPAHFELYKLCESCGELIVSGEKVQVQT